MTGTGLVGKLGRVNTEYSLTGETSSDGLWVQRNFGMRRDRHSPLEVTERQRSSAGCGAGTYGKGSENNL